MDTFLLSVIAAVILYAVVFAYLLKKAKKEKADFKKSYGHLVGTFGCIDTRNWLFADDINKTPITEINELSMPVFCKNCDWPAYLYCSIREIYPENNGVGSYDVALEQIHAEFEVRYISKTLLILYSKKYGETLLKRPPADIQAKVGEYVFLFGKIYRKNAVEGYVIDWSITGY